jgi:hypothetical protein
VDNRKLEDLRSDLDTIREDLDRLLAMAEAAGVGRRRRFGEYLETLDRKQADMHVALERVDDGRADIDIDEIEAGVREAWARLAIAKRAAEARFAS